MRRLAFLAVALPLSAACGSGSVSADYTAFCTVANNMETVASGPHGEDPAAITDPTVMGETWAKVVIAAEELRDQSPAEIKDDVALMVSTLIDMNDVFKQNDYDLVEMAKNEELRKKVDAISQREGVAEASGRFNTFVEDKCSDSQ